MPDNNQVHPYQLLNIDERVKRVLRNTPLADGHNDLPQQPRCCFKGKIHNNPKFDLEKGFQRGMTDLPRLKQGAVGLQFWSICVPHLRGSEDFALPQYNDMCRDAIEQIDLSIRMVKQYPKDFELIFGPENVRNIYQQGKIACSLGLEGLHQAGNSIRVIRAYHQLGIRYCTMTHVENNAFADSSTSKVGPVHGGLSRLGKAAVKEMNRLGMMVDLSHVSPEAAEQALKCTVAPVIFSHSNARGVFDCPRNVPDSVLDLVLANDGIVMVTFVPEHLAARRSEATVDMLLDHLFYMANRIGWEHVGLGSDFDGIASVIPGLEDCSRFPALLQAILDRGATEEHLALVAGENILREDGVTPVEDVWEGREFWRYDGYYQMPDPDPEDNLGLDCSVRLLFTLSNTKYYVHPHINTLPCATQTLLNMDDIQLDNLSIGGVARTRPLQFLDLPKEIRMMIYRYALHRRLIKNSFPALLSVNRLIRKEASTTFYRQNHFLLKLQPQPHTTTTVLGLDGKTREWLALIGPKHINNLRHVVFSFPGTKVYHFDYNEYFIDLSCRDAGGWDFSITTGPCRLFRTLQGDLDEAQSDTHYTEIAEFLRKTGFPISDAVVADFKRDGIIRYTAALRCAQEVMDQFSDQCGEGKLVKPTIGGLEMIGRVFMAVEQARFGHDDY
ncbi:hypothetical protein KCU78_g1480, partial [Aureobasidium melanogenum]